MDSVSHGQIVTYNFEKKAKKDKKAWIPACAGMTNNKNPRLSALICG